MRKPRPNGVVALVTVLIVMATLVSLGLVIAAVGRDEIVLAHVVDNGEKALMAADACVEEALQRLKLDANYAGGSFALDGVASCSISVSNLGGNSRLVVGQGSYREAIMTIEARVTILANVQGEAKRVRIESWLEAN